MSARSGTDELEHIRVQAAMDEVVRKAALLDDPDYQRLERENTSLREQLRLAQERADAAENRAAHLQKRLDVAHESISFAHDKMAERERQARWEVATESLEKFGPHVGGEFAIKHLQAIRDANAPKD